MQTAAFSIRPARRADAAAIAGFNTAMAKETEGKELIPEVIGAGVAKLLETPALGFYLVAEAAGKPIACLLITNEWSDWRNGLFWWIQSVYVVTEWRRKGVYRTLYDHVREMAKSEPGVCGFRLYVEKDNAAGHRTYSSLGMELTHYQIYEELRPGVKYLR